MHSSTARSSGRPGGGGLHQAPREQAHLWEQTLPGPDPRPETCCKACWDTTCNACWDSNPPHETCCKACWDTTCNACWDSTPPVNRITDACKNITLPQLRFIITNDNSKYKIPHHSQLQPPVNFKCKVGNL